MRLLLFLCATVLVAAQTTATKSQSSTTAKPATARSSTTHAAKPAAPPSAPLTLTTDTEKIIYALGLSIDKSLQQFDLTPKEMDLVKRGMADAAASKPAEDLNQWGPRIQGFARERAVALTAKEKATSQAYLAKAAAEPGVVKTDSGLIYRELTPGTGPSPKATDTVKVNYRGTLVDGSEFDSSYKRNEPAQFPLNGVIRCWTEGVQKMKVGEKAKLICPADIAYGDAGRPGIPGGAALTFEIELLGIVNPPTPAGPPQTPAAKETAPVEQPTVKPAAPPLR